MAADHELIAEEYGYIFPDHWLLPDDSIWTAMHHAYVDRAIALLRKNGVKRVIEVGCGDGWNCGKAVEAGMEVVGIDWSRNGIDHARRLVPQGEFHCGDIRDEDFLSRYRHAFDGALFVEVLEHIPPSDCATALRNIAELLEPGATLVLTTPSTNLPNNNPQHYRHFTEESLRAVFDEAEVFRIQHIEGYGDVPAETQHYRLARWVNNRYWEVHPAKRWLQNRYARHCLDTPPERRHGHILVAKLR